ncbi:uncharacterized protein B0I36DRAFT_360165 [Microdochium trichocladiopsis]|uniref:Uncharacterized protein n=1 Tax=Microdochium trichocladiopsis TaxID=1682393 RepID=A0A9P9BSP6_9PEZI|nr:uncharacterized protein B0I36DRAFT_360165 [Microdochium trichocladiopsis]KAH7034667.1 hypothetical protein B0I36DRAFT_360165 [Microdochium trichocladiopsis]
METPSAAASSATPAAAAAAAAAASRAGRGRSTTKRRHVLPLARSSSSRPPDSTDLPPTPTDQMAPSSFAYETPSPSSSRSIRGVRHRQGEAAVQSPEDADAKGGRSLRRKPRIDYSFDHQLEDSDVFAARATPSAARSLKKRKTDISFLDGDADEEHELRVKRRASEQPLPAAGSARRKAAARKTTVEPQVYVPDQQADDVEVQDTIEVGGRHSMHSDDSFRARTSSGGSSHHDLTPKAGLRLSSITHPEPPSSPPPQPSQPTAVPPAASVITQAREGVSPPTSHPVLESHESAIEDDAPQPESQSIPSSAPQKLEEPEQPASVQPAAEPVVAPTPTVPSVEEDIKPPAELQTEPQSAPKAASPLPQPQSQSQAEPQVPRKSSPAESAPVDLPAAPSAPVKEELKPTPQKSVAVPAESKHPEPQPKKPVDDKNDPLGHLTPYISGATVLFPKIKSTGEPDADADPEVEADQEAAPDGEPDGTLDETAQPGEDAGDEPADAADEDTPIGTPLVLETAANSPAPEPEAAAMLPSKRQYAFRKTRDASEFTSLFDDLKGLSYTELYYRLEVANRALQAWQSEFNALRLITEDEDNSIRYHQEELAFQHREKMALSKDPSANPLRKDFVVKGTRAPKTDPHLAYLRQQDKVMAQAYLFDYDDRESKISQQDPVSQRTGAAGKARLRDRPKQTAKAAEADDPAVVSGKRARKAPTLFDGMEGASRSSTPAPSSQPKRRRRGAGQGGDDNGEFLPSSADAIGDAVPAKKGKGGRPRKHPLPISQTEGASGPASEDGPTLPTPNIVERPVRKRRRRDLDEEDEALANGTASEASKQARRRNSRLSEVPTGSFYSQSSAYADEDNRPATASSTASNTTADSSPNNYSLREKRQKKFSLDDGEYDDVGGAEDDDGATAIHSRPAKRARRGPRKSYVEQVMPLTDEYAVDMSQPEQSQIVAPKPTPKIKIKNYQPSSASSTAAARSAAPVSTGGHVPSPYSPAPSQTMDSPTTQGGSFHSNGHTPQTEPEIEKDYSTMTKSEKMSYSMKARWASGSMSAAVSKRRATLAAKKSARAATPPKPAAPEAPAEAPPAVAK